MDQDNPRDSDEGLKSKYRRPKAFSQEPVPGLWDEGMFDINSLPEWAIELHSFICSGESKFLEQSIELVGNTLAKKYLRAWLKDEPDCEPALLTRVLKLDYSQNKDSVIMAIDALLFMTPHRLGIKYAGVHLSEDTDYKIDQVWGRCGNIAYGAGLYECYVVFAEALAKHYAHFERWDNARCTLYHLRRALEALRRKRYENYSVREARCLCSYGHVLLQLREYSASIEASEIAVDQFAALALKDSEYICEYAGTLSNLAMAYLRQGRGYDAIPVLEGSVAVFRKLCPEHPCENSQYLAMALSNLGSAFADCEDWRAAIAKYLEACSLYGMLELSDSRNQIYHAQTLYNTSLALILNGHRRAIDYIDKAEAICREVVRQQPDLNLELLAIILALKEIMVNCGAPLNTTVGDSPKAVVESQSNSVAKVERLWLAKDAARYSYLGELKEAALRNQPKVVYSIASAMISEYVSSKDVSSSNSLNEVRSALRRLDKFSGKKTKLLSAVRIPREGSVMLLIDPDDKSLGECVFESEFTCKAIEFQQHLLKAFSKMTRTDAAAWWDAARSLSFKLTGLLDDRIRSKIFNSEDSLILVSGDPFWTSFQWEALSEIDGADQRWLGLFQPLPRIDGIDAEYLSHLRSVMPGGGRTAFIVCPWNATENELRSSQTEVMEIEEMLREQDYEVSISIGRDANHWNFAKGILSLPSVIHFSGHGAIKGREEVLVLSGVTWNEPSVFGRNQINAFRDEFWLPGLFPHGPIIVLNSCWSARSRQAGGRNEDLAGTLIREGASAVVGSPVPIFDTIGQIAGTSLYEPSFADSRGVAYALLRVRRLIESVARHSNVLAGHSWMNFSFRGNPFVTFPSLSGIDDRPSGWNKFIGALKRRLKLKTTETFIEEVESIRSS